MHNRNKEPFPLWLGGVLIALVLILIGTRLNTGGAGNPVLMSQFAPRPTDPNAPTPEPWKLPQVHLPSLPPAVQSVINDTRNKYLGGGAVPALTPVAESARLRVEVQNVQRDGERVMVTGTVSNIGNEPVLIPPDAFSFRDSAGVVYTISGSSGSVVDAGQSTPLQLAVPLPAERGLTLLVTLAPDPTIEQTLLVETTS